jgi:hypothetical protein
MQPGCSLGDAASRLVGGHDDIGDRTRQEPLRDGERDQLRIGARCRQNGLGAGAPIKRQQLGSEVTQPVLDLNRGSHSPPEQRLEVGQGRAVAQLGDRAGCRRREPGLVGSRRDGGALPAAAGEWIGPNALIASR